MAFRVGQKVVCVDADGDFLPSGQIEEGRVYTIREVGLTVTDEGGLRLVEVDLSAPGYVGRHSRKPVRDNFYRASRFRPVVERKTDISIFTAMLTGTKKRRVVVLGEG